MFVQKIHTCTGHRAAVYALTSGRRAGEFFSAGGDKWLVSWDWNNPDTGKLLAEVETQVFSMAYDAESGWLVAGNMNGGLHFVSLTDAAGNRNILHHQRGVFGLVFAKGFLFTAGGDGILTRWSLLPLRSVESVQLSAVSLRSLVYCAERNEFAVGASDNHIYLLDADTLTVRHTVRQAHNNSVFRVRYSPTGRFLLSGGRDAMLRVWDTGDHFRLVSEQPAHWFTINDIAFSPDGRLVATGSRDKTIKIWSSEQFELLKVIDTQRSGGHINSVNALLWMPEGLVSAGDDRSLMLWAVND